MVFTWDTNLGCQLFILEIGQQIIASLGRSCRETVRWIVYAEIHTKLTFN